MQIPEKVSTFEDFAFRSPLWRTRKIRQFLQKTEKFKLNDAIKII
jgi:hypothetical protein